MVRACKGPSHPVLTVREAALLLGSRASSASPGEQESWLPKSPSEPAAMPHSCLVEYPAAATGLAAAQEPGGNWHCLPRLAVRPGSGVGVGGVRGVGVSKLWVRLCVAITSARLPRGAALQLLT